MPSKSVRTKRRKQIKAIARAIGTLHITWPIDVNNESPVMDGGHCLLKALGIISKNHGRFVGKSRRRGKYPSRRARHVRP